MSHGIFITGTDTGVGKTYIAEKIASALTIKGVDVGVMKPAETGCRVRSGKLMPADTLRLKAAAHCDDSLDLLNPYRFRKPLAPFVAARLEGKKINPPKIINVFQTLAQKHEFMIVEGAGGIMVPLTRCYTFCDLAFEIGLPVVIVARPGLGTINHTLLTISALRESGIPIAGVIINYAEAQRNSAAEMTNPGVISALSGVKILGIVQHGQDTINSIVKLLS